MVTELPKGADLDTVVDAYVEEWLTPSSIDEDVGFFSGRGRGF